MGFLLRQFPDKTQERQAGISCGSPLRQHLEKKFSGNLRIDLDGVSPLAVEREGFDKCCGNGIFVASDRALDGSRSFPNLEEHAQRLTQNQ
jgi:hypothetical protein